MKKKIVGILICTLVIAATVLPVVGTGIKNPNSSSSRPAICWEKTFGGDKIDWGCCVQQTFDGGYIISGTCDRNRLTPWQGYCYLIKMDDLGNEEWSQRQEVNACWEVVGQCVQQTDDDGDGDKDDGYIIAGYTGFTWQIDVYLAKTDADGETVWMHTFGKSEAFDRGNSVQQTTDGGYIIAGCTQSYGIGGSDVWLIKTDADGNEEWNQTFGGDGIDSGNSVQQTSDGGYIIVGDTYSFGVHGDVYLIKTDDSGNEEWSQTFGGNGWDGGHDVQQTTDDGYIITGRYTNDAGNKDVYLIETDADGNEEWSQTFGGNNDDEGYSVQQTTDGGYFITGYYDTHSIDWLPDVYLIKTDADGNEEWQQTLDKDGAEDVGYCGKQTSDEGYIITGHTGIYLDETYDVWVIKLGDEPPVSIELDGMLGDNGWYVSCVTITFVVNGEEVDYIMYKIDGGEWNTYTEPFEVCEDGEHTICWYYVDNEGNQSEVECMDFKIDQTDPTIELIWDDENSKLVATVDDETSGVAKVIFYVNDEFVGEVTTAPYDCEVTDPKIGDKGQAMVFDNAGNDAVSEEIDAVSQSQNPRAAVQHWFRAVRNLIWSVHLRLRVL